MINCNKALVSLSKKGDVVGCTENCIKIEAAITVVMSLCELLKGTYFSNSIDETFSESCLSSVCNHFLSMIVLDHCVPNKLVCASLLLTLLHGIF
jgi:hypothetical protein